MSETTEDELFFMVNIRGRSADYYVYVLFRENGLPFYVGLGRGKRWDHHERDARVKGAGRGGNRHKIAIIRKMQAAGLDIPKVKIATGLTLEQASAYEVAWIAALGRPPNGLLVNLTAGGEGSVDYKHSPEARARMAALARARSPEHRAKLSAANLGKPLSPERSAKIAAKNRSPERRAKLSVVHAGKTISAEHRAKVGKAARSPEHRARLAMRNRSPEGRAKSSITARSPENIARLAMRNRSPEARAKSSITARSPENLARLATASRNQAAKARPTVATDDDL